MQTNRGPRAAIASLALVAALALPACSGGDDPCPPGDPACADPTPDCEGDGCDGAPDNDPDVDDDGDGVSEAGGDCNDRPGDDGALIGPGAIEVAVDADGAPEGVDNDCDGEIDEAFEPCPTTPTARDDPETYANALEICHQLVSASWRAEPPIDVRSRNVRPGFGAVYRPSAGPSLMAMSTGLAVDRAAPAWVRPDPGTHLHNSLLHPDPGATATCDGASFDDPARVNDFSELALVLDVPQNARALAFDFNFMSAEFPEFVCSEFDDTFIAYLESTAFEGNVSFDANDQRVSINIGFFDVCGEGLAPQCTGAADLAGTGFQGDAGGTGWLTTTAPVTPGERITLTFMIWDEGDHDLDSLVLLDHLRWNVEAVDRPNTVERRAPDRGAAAATTAAGSIGRAAR